MSSKKQKRQIVWLCKECGKTGKNRLSVGDEHCFDRAQAVYADSIVREGNKVSAIVAPEPKGQTRNPVWIER